MPLMRRSARCHGLVRAIGTLGLVLLAAALAGLRGHGPAAGSLAVWDGGGWQVFWSRNAAPPTWPAAHPAVANAVTWTVAAPGVEAAELRLAVTGTAWRLRVALVRLDPRLLSFTLVSSTRDAGLLGAWTVDSTPPGTSVAFNAGQFAGGTPWGWRVEQGRELSSPGAGPLAMAVAVDTGGSARLLAQDEIEAARAGGDIVTAFQSYPAVLVSEGSVPPQLLGPGRGVDLAHRDARLAVGILADGRLLLALTRLDVGGGAAGALPFGPTTPEMAALMGALGCRRAVLLDGGLSAQLALRGADGRHRTWPGLRRVPLGIVATPREKPDQRSGLSPTYSPPDGP